MRSLARRFHLVLPQRRDAKFRPKLPSDEWWYMKNLVSPLCEKVLTSVYDRSRVGQEKTTLEININVGSAP